MTNFPSYSCADAELHELLQRLTFAFLGLSPRPSSDSMFPQFKPLSCGVYRLKKMENSCLPAEFPSIPFAIGGIVGLTGLTLHTSLSGRKQWQKADSSAAAQSLWSRFLHLIQGPMNKVFLWCTYTHTHTYARSCAEVCFQSLISNCEHSSRTLCPKINGHWLCPLQTMKEYCTLHNKRDIKIENPWPRFVLCAIFHLSHLLCSYFVMKSMVLPNCRKYNPQREL